MLTGGAADAACVDPVRHLQPLTAFWAIDVYKSALAIKPDDADAYYNMGRAYNAMGRHAEAIAAYKSALATKPDYAKAYYNLGINYLRLTQYRQAISAWEQYLRLEPTGTLADEVRRNIELVKTRLGNR